MNINRIEEILNNYATRSSFDYNVIQEAKKELAELKKIAEVNQVLDVPDLNPGEFIEFIINHRKTVQINVKKDELWVSFTQKLNDIDAADLFGRLLEKLGEMRDDQKHTK